MTRLAVAGLLSLALLVSASGCVSSMGSGGGATNANDVSDRLFKMQKDLAKILDRLDEIDSRDAEQESEDSDRKNLARVSTQLDSIEQQLQQLQTLLAEDRSRIEDLAGMLRSLRARTDVPSWSTPEQIAAATRRGQENGDGEPAGETGDAGLDGMAQGQDPAAQGGPSPENLFNAAYTDFSRGKFEVALAGFEAALRADLIGPRADDAQYWIGETLVELERYDEAIKAFDRVLVAYPESDMRLPSLLKKGLALFEARRTAEAVTVLQSLIDEHPDSDEARIAEEYLTRRGVEFQ